MPRGQRAGDPIPGCPGAGHRRRKSTCGAFPTSVIIPALRSVRQRSSAVEQGTHKPLVGGSIPPAGTTDSISPRRAPVPFTRDIVTESSPKIRPKNIAQTAENCRIFPYTTILFWGNGVGDVAQMTSQDRLKLMHLCRFRRPDAILWDSAGWNALTWTLTRPLTA